MLHHQEWLLSTGLLNNLQQQQVCDKCSEGLNIVHVQTQEIVDAARSHGIQDKVCNI
jgi:hypothetical protein